MPHRPIGIPPFQTRIAEFNRIPLARVSFFFIALAPSSDTELEIQVAGRFPDSFIRMFSEELIKWQNLQKLFLGVEFRQFLSKQA
jgi:hypothetical protein